MQNRRMRVLGFIRNHWGFFIFGLLSLIALIRLLGQDLPGHYRIFTSAAMALWAGENPHGTDFGTGVGFWFYSPTCGMFFFGPFALLPEKIGLFSYMALSWILFVIGVRAYFGSLRGEGILNFFWFAIAPQVFLAILASKLEIAMTGLLLLASAWLIQGRRMWGASLIFALLLNWKFQPLPTIGLLAVVFLILRRSIVLPAQILAASVLWGVLPLFFHSPSFIASVYRAWNDGLTEFVTKAYSDFDNIFSFLAHALHLPVTFGQSQAISVVAGAILAILLGAWAWMHRRKRGGEDRILAEGIGLSLALGAAFTVGFSPLSQNNAYILYTPLLGFAFLSSFPGVATNRETGRTVLRWATIVTWLIVGFAYSDLVPAGLRSSLRHLSLKPVFCVGLALILIGVHLSRTKTKREMAS